MELAYTQAHSLTSYVLHRKQNLSLLLIHHRSLVRLNHLTEVFLDRLIRHFWLHKMVGFQTKYVGIKLGQGCQCGIFCVNIN